MMRKFFLVLLLILIALPVYAQENRGNCDAPDALESRLVGGMYAIVVQETVVYREATTSAPQVFTLPAGQQIYLTSAPQCADGLLWYQAQFDPAQGANGFGWVVESQNGAYNLEPMLQTLAVPQERAEITAENAATLTQVGQVEFGLVNDLIWSPDGTRLAVNAVGAVWTYNLTQPDAQPLFVSPVERDTNMTTSVRFSEDGQTLVTAGGISPSTEMQRPGVITWSLEDGSELARLELPLEEFGGVAAISPDQQVVALANWNGDISLWDTQSGALINTLIGHSLVGGLVFSGDGSTLVSLGSGGMMMTDMSVRFWDTQTGEQIGLLELPDVPLWSALSPDGSVLALVYTPDPSQPTGPRTYLITVPTGNEILQLPASFGAASMSFNPDGSLLAIASSNFDANANAWVATVNIYDTATGALASSLPFNSELRDVAWSPDGTLLAVALADPQFWGPNRVTLWAAGE